jgi:hypothetical protein
MRERTKRIKRIKPCLLGSRYERSLQKVRIKGVWSVRRGAQAAPSFVNGCTSIRRKSPRDFKALDPFFGFFVFFVRGQEATEGVRYAQP